MFMMNIRYQFDIELTGLYCINKHWILPS